MINTFICVFGCKDTNYLPFNHLPVTIFFHFPHFCISHFTFSIIVVPFSPFFCIFADEMMITKQITASNADEQIRQLYETAFPEEEQIPWDDLMHLIGEMHLDFTAYYDGDIFVGFTIIYPRPSFSWYWYFAVREELRGKGYGQQILSDVIQRYKGQTSVFDMESPRQECANIEQRKRRHAFYLRNGFRDTNVYRRFDAVEMTIMMMGEGTFTIDDWNTLTNELRQHWTWD